MTGPLRVGRNTSGDADYPHRLFLDGNPLGFVMLTDAEAGAIEAQLAGGTLRIVDVGGTGLPRWPDLTELRAAWDALPDEFEVEAIMADLLDAVRHLMDAHQ